MLSFGCGSGNTGAPTAPTTITTTTTLTSSSTSTTTGASITLTAAVSPSAATGTVTFYSGSTSLGAGTLSSGTATLTTSFSSAGTYSITATYGGSSSDSSSTSSAVPISVSASALSVSTSSLTNPVYGQSYQATLIATGGTGSGYSWSVFAGQSSLTAINLSLSSSGVLSGVPGAIGASTFTVMVTDSGGNTAKATYTIGVSNPQPKPSGTLTAATVTVTSQSAGTLPSSFLGFSYGKTIVNSTPYALSSADTGLINLFRLLIPAGGSSNPPILRIGGSQVDSMIWNNSGAGGNSNYVEPPDIDSLAGFIAATGWQTIYGINLASTSPNYTTAAPQTTILAQQEVSYLAGDFSAAGALAPMYEIGNECDNYNHSGHPYNGVTGWTTNSAALLSFEALWSTYQSAILGAVPSSVITGPASGNNETTWTEPFAQWATSSRISLMTQHYYRFSSGTNPTPANLINYPDNENTDCTATSGCPNSDSLTSNTTNTGDGVTGDGTDGYIGNPGSCSNNTGLTCTANALGIPWRMSETNSLNNASTGPLGTANGYGSALWLLDHMFTIAYGGGSGVNVSGISNEATGYQPISFSSTNSTPNTSVASVNPSYYAMLLFSQMGFGTLYDTLVNAGSLNVSAYTVQTAGGAQNLMVVNKDATNNLNLTINLAKPVSYASLMLMTQLTSGNTAPDLTSPSGVTIQGSSVSTAGAFSPGALNTCTVTSGTVVNCYVPIESAVVIQMQ